MREGRLPIPPGNKLFGAAVFQAHGASRLPRQQGHQYGEATLVLIAKATTHAGTDDAYLGRRYPEHMRQRLAVIGVHGAARLPDRQRCALPLGQRSARLHAYGGVDLGTKRAFKDPCGPGQSLGHMAALYHQRPASYQVPLRVHAGGVRAQRLLGIKDGG